MCSMLTKLDAPQTNPPGQGLGGLWTDVAGSTAANTMTFPLSRTNSVFYRLRLP